jgi:tetratricopeptide (TPR) repeat protein
VAKKTTLTMGCLAVVLAAALVPSGPLAATLHRGANAESCLACLGASDLAACHEIAVELATSLDWKRAIAIEEGIHQKQPLNAEVSSVLAKMYYQGDKNTPRAIALYHEALHAVSGYPPALLGLGTIMQEQGEMEIAARYFSRGSRERPDVPLFKVRLADVLVRSGREAEARPVLLEIVQRWPGSAEAESARKLIGRTELARP